MNPSKISALETEVSELKKLVKNLLDKVNKLAAENTSLRDSQLAWPALLGHVREPEENMPAAWSVILKIPERQNFRVRSYSEVTRTGT